MIHPPVGFRSRHMVLTAVDEAAYSKLLIEDFPDIRYFDEPPPSAMRGPRPPEIELHTSLSDCDSRYVAIIFDPKWQPRWENSDRPGQWVLANLPYPNGDARRSGRIYPPGKRSAGRDGMGPDPPHLNGGEIYFRCRKGVKADKALASKALRLLGKIATNKRQMRVRYPFLDVVAYDEKGSHLWIGQDAIRWLREDPERMTGYNSYVKIGYRPMDE